MSVLLRDGPAVNMWVCFREARGVPGEHWMNLLASTWTSHAWRDRLAVRPYGSISHVEVCFEMENGSFRRCSIMKKGRVFFRPSRSPNLWRDYVAVRVPVSAEQADAARLYCEDAVKRGSGFNAAGFFVQFLLWPSCFPGSVNDTYFCVEVVMGALRASGAPVPPDLAPGNDGRTSPNALFDCMLAWNATGGVFV